MPPAVAVTTADEGLPVTFVQPLAVEPVAEKLKLTIWALAVILQAQMIAVDKNSTDLLRLGI
jgi:ABC-type thiamin/hydroxymethylpyrimidine transport system permease subunit